MKELQRTRRDQLKQYCEGTISQGQYDFLQHTNDRQMSQLQSPLRQQGSMLMPSMRQQPRI